MCYCLCFNKQNNILAVGCGSDIKIFQFENGNLTEIQILKGHTLAVNCLYISLNNEIFSCSQDYTIKRWVYENNQWILAEEFKEHQSSIMCMVMNRTEEAFFTSSFDKTIKYWIQIKNIWKCVQTFGKMSFSLSLNQSQTLLLSHELMIYKQDQKSQWALIQTLQSEEFGFRASFIGENLIAHQICNKGILRLYENSQKNPKFIVKMEIKVQDGSECLFFFPQIYCTQLGILINKHNKFINIIKIKKESKIQVEQAIEFQTTQIYGTLTEDGKYLVTYDGNQQQFAIRKLL